MKKYNDTSWESSAGWYDKTVGAKGHYYHQQVILPNLLRMLAFNKNEPTALLDLACGQGILSRHLPTWADYTGIDASRTLIGFAKKDARNPKHQFRVADLSAPLDLQCPPFSHAVCLLAVQNIENVQTLFENASRHLKPGGKFLFVLNHPSFRIPRQSHWEVDASKKCQYRRVDMYMSQLKIPIQTHPSQQGASPSTWSFHRPLSAYSAALKQAGFFIDQIEEWCSDKQSTGKMASMENRSRKEFPLFMAIAAIKR